MHKLLTKNIFSHVNYFYGLILSIIFGITIFLASGEVKPWAIISWLDVLAEGGVTLLGLLWLVLLLRSRPGGHVTSLLAIGLCCIIFSWSMDVTDEFIKLPSDIIWHGWLESLPTVFALIFLSAGIYHWHKEELAISAQMVNRERNFRDVRLFDKLIPVGGAVYLRKQLRLLIKESQQQQSPLSLVAINLNNFNTINRYYGVEEGDNILRSVCQLLLLNFREQDILCRFAGDRFVVLLPDTSESKAHQIALELEAAISSLAYKDRQSTDRVYLTASTIVILAEEESSKSVLERLNIQFSATKQGLA